MTELLGAVVISSILGSLHCVGMCGPMAVLAMGRYGKEESTTPTQLGIRLVAYHLGRLTTYLVLGFIAGSAALFLNQSGALMGIPRSAARLAGVALIVIGLWKLAVTWYPDLRTSPHGQWSLRVAQVLAQFRALIGKLPQVLRSYTIGGLTTLLPCGWLYVFVLVSAGTGRPLFAMLVMTAFWVGSLPALTAAVSGFTRLGQSMGTALPILVAVMLIATGWYTATGRAETNLAPLAARAAAAQEIFKSDTQRNLKTLNVLQKAPLPCCEPSSSKHSHEQ